MVRFASLGNNGLNYSFILSFVNNLMLMRCVKLVLIITVVTEVKTYEDFLSSMWPEITEKSNLVSLLPTKYIVIKPTSHITRNIIL